LTGLDKLDVKILRELIQDQSYPILIDFRRSLRIIGKKFSVDEHTVKNRVAKLRQLGLWEGWRLFLNPRLLGIRFYIFWLDIPPHSKDDLLRKLRLIEGVVVINDYHGNVIAVQVYCQDEQSLRKKIELISAMSNSENVAVGEFSLPQCEVSLKSTDWQIARSMLANARKTYNVVGKELGLSTKTVKRRLRRMIEGKALFAGRYTSLKLFKGAVLADLVVLYVNSESRAGVDKKITTQFDDYVYFVGQFIGVGLFRLIIPNLTIADEILSWVKGQSGVRSARVELLKDRIQLYGVLDEQLGRKLEEIRLPTP
jgi:DNA-binding Lrp family transcriptional regulator